MSEDTNRTAPGRIGTTYADSTPWWPEPARPAEGSPDVIVIVLDDVGFGSIGSYGSEIDTPHIDALAAGGMQFSNFHATALCSPTRASLLTGRNHHSVGMSLLSNADSGFPSKRGTVSHHAATVAEVLRDRGYSTAAFGKWHLAPLDQTSSVGPFDQWPLGRGFERFYGFLEGITDHFFPELVQDNQRIRTPGTPEDGYHLTEDLTQRAMDFVSDQKSGAPDKPYLMYLAYGAAHTPHQAPREYLEKYRGQYDAGWDVIRERRLAKQIATGLVPEGTQLAPHNDSVVPWDTLDDDERLVMARMQEAFAAMLDHTDVQIGRLLAHLEQLGVRDDTVIVFMSDNGASQEGGANGTTNTITYENGDTVTTAQNLADLDEIGGPRNHSNYPWGWAQAGNTPLKRYKQNTHAGGVRVPFVINWPAGIQAESAGFRHQFHSVIDVTPTLLEIAGASMPELYRGVPQLPVHGESMTYLIDDPAAPTVRDSQYFEMYGHRAIWHDGWKAVSFHTRHDAYEDDVWELYHLAEDFSEHDDLAATEPERLQNLIGRWWAEAARYEVFPLDDRNFAERAAKYHSAASPRRRRSYRMFPGMQVLPGGVTPLIYDRSYDFTASVRADATRNGTLFAHGDVNGGHILYVSGEELVYEYNHQGTRYTSAGRLPSGRIHALGVRVIKTGDLQARAELTCNGDVVGAGDLLSTARYMIGWQGLTVGRMIDSPVTWNVDSSDDFVYEGTLIHVDVELHADGPHDVHEVID